MGEVRDFAGTDNGVTVAFFTAGESALVLVLALAGLALFFPGLLAVLLLVFVVLVEGDAEADTGKDSKDEAADAAPLDFGFGFGIVFPWRKKLPNVRWLGDTSFFVRDCCWDLAVDFFLAGEGEAVAAGMAFAVAGALLWGTDTD